MKQNSSTGVAAVVLVLLVAIACSTVRDGKPAAEAAVVEFHAMLDQEKYAEIYAAADAELKKTATEEELTRFLTAVRTKLGSVRSSTTQSWKVGNFNLTSTIELVQETEFEHGKGSEDFVFVYSGKKVTLAGYHINSNDLLTNSILGPSNDSPPPPKPARPTDDSTPPAPKPAPPTKD